MIEDEMATDNGADITPSDITLTLTDKELLYLASVMGYVNPFRCKGDGVEETVATLLNKVFEASGDLGVSDYDKVVFTFKDMTMNITIEENE